ncbi:hypothetical protein EN808_31970 [Mesorhizobium sp. M8A.F.Ca.ET.165.01.1.1]|nr:hypothetical protein EN808_31970 [Mesorhizobium sp. M8A.F.Ca.ET.165.01.1.1]
MRDTTRQPYVPTSPLPIKLRPTCAKNEIPRASRNETLSIAEELECAADRIADMSRAGLQAILRRAGNLEHIGVSYRSRSAPATRRV